MLDESNRSDSLAISIETYLGKKKSSISSSNLLDENLKTLIEKCCETTKITPDVHLLLFLNGGLMIHSNEFFLELQLQHHVCLTIL
ncbi:hypothetical protein N8709_04225 [Candidatus Pelagibacter sp.]|nr:hypothetical protein [Candidatus Pelagibacter sp.]